MASIYKTERGFGYGGDGLEELRDSALFLRRMMLS